MTGSSHPLASHPMSDLQPRIIVAMSEIHSNYMAAIALGLASNATGVDKLTGWTGKDWDCTGRKLD